MTKSPTVYTPSKEVETALRLHHVLYGFFMSACIFLILSTLVIFAWNFYQRTHKPIPNYYEVLEGDLAATIDGSLFPALTLKGKAEQMRVLNQPNLMTNAVLHWAQNAATMALTFNFNNYSQVIEESRVYFTPEGYKNFISAMNSARLLQDIQKKQLAVYAVATDTPIVLKEGAVTEGSYAWQVQFPMLLTFESERADKLNVVVTLLISRIPTSESVSGIGIASFVMNKAERSSAQ